MSLSQFYEDLWKLAAADSISYIACLREAYTISFVKDEISLKPMSKGNLLVDIGCGAANYSRELSKATSSTFVGVDISSTALQESKKRISTEEDPLCLGLVQGDAAQLPLASSRFDFILCVHTLEHLPEDDPTLEELHRILKKDSYLRLVVPNSLKQMLSIFRPLERRLSELGHLREYSLEAIMELLPPHHFEIHQIYYSDFLLSWVLFSAEEHLRSLVRRSSFARTIKRLMLRSRRASYPFTAVLGLLLFWENKLLRNCSWGMNICCIAQRIE